MNYFIYTMSWQIISAMFSIAIFIDDYKHESYYELTPSWIYKNYDIGIIGVVVLSATMMAFFPFYYILWFVYWLFHIKKGDKK